MKESIPTPENVSRDQVVDAYKKFAEQGYPDPGGLNLDDPEVIAAQDLFDKWAANQDSNDERVNFEKTKLFIDAGFTGPAYLEEVLGWLLQDAHNAEKDINDPDRVQLRKDMAEEIKKIRSLLKQPQSDSQ